MIAIDTYTLDELRSLDIGIGNCPTDLNMNDQLPLLNFVDIWLELFKKNTVKAGSYGRLLISRNALEKFEISRKRICDIGFIDIQQYINQLVESGYSLSGIKKQALIVTAPLRQAAALRLLKADPCVGVRMPTETRIKKKTKEIVAYTEDEQKRLVGVVTASPWNAGYLAVLLMIETGLRSGELLALKWTDIEIDRSRMRVHATIVNPMYKTAEYQDSPKSKSSNRTIPLTPKAIMIFRSLMARRTTEWVFEQDGARYTYQKLMYQTKKLCREANIRYYGEHAFRHTFATNCYYKGIDVKILSKLMGHSSVQITYNIYINLYGDGFDSMYAALCF